MSVRKDTVQLEVIINGQKAGENMKQLRGTLRDLNRELDTLEFGTDAFNKKAAEIAQATAKMNQHKKAIRDAAGEIENAGKKVNPFVDALKKGALAFGLFFGVQQVVQWGKQFLHFITAGTIALEDMRDKTVAVFGDAIDIIQDFAVINAQALGVTEEKYASLASEIGAVLVQMGFLEEEAAQMSAEALNVAGAIAEWSNGQLTLAQSSEIIQKALLGQTKGLKQIGVAISEVDIKNRLAAEGQDKLTGLALKQAKAQATLQLIIERTGKAQAEFAASSDDAGRAVSRIGQYFDQQKEKLLSGLLPAYKAFTNTIANFLSPLKRQSDLTRESQAQFNVQIETLKRGDLSYGNRIKLINQINAKYKDYLPNLLTEKTSLSEINAIQGEVNKKFQQKILLLATEEALVDANAKQIKLTAEELELQTKLTAETQKFTEQLQKAGATRGGKRGSTQFVEDEKFAKAFESQEVQRAAANAQRVQDRIDANKLEQEEVRKQMDLTRAAAEKLGLDINAILNPEGPGIIPADELTDPAKKIKDALQFIEDQYNKERHLKIQSIEFLRDNEELYAAERERINLEADIKIATAQAQIYKEGSVENLKLLQDALDNEAQLRTNALELSFSQREEQINRESELTKLAIREEITDKDELTRKLEIAELEGQQRLATVKLAGLKKADAEYVALYNEITDRQTTIDEKKNEDTLAGIISTLNITRDQKILALDAQQLTEEKYLEEREKIEIQSVIDSLDAQLALFEGSAEDRIALELRIADARKKINKSSESGLFGGGTVVDNGGGRSTPDDREAQLQERLQQAKDATLDTAHNVADTLLSIERDRIDETLRHEIDAIDQLADAKRRAAGDDAVELAKIDAQARAAREKAEKKAAQDRKKLARKEAIIQGALAVVEALPNAFAAIAAGIATGLQLAVIDGQSFFYGGPTGSKGIYRDKSGKNVAGVVHTNEYVVPEHIAQDPKHQPVISYLENVRRAKGGFAEGGFTNVSTRPAAYVQTVTSATSTVTDARMLELMERLVQITAAWPLVVKAQVVYTELEKVGQDLNYIRDQANA